MNTADIIFWSIAAVAVLAVTLLNWVRNGGFKKQEYSRLKQEYGKKPHVIKQERWQYLKGYYQSHTAECSLDEITWNDLEMDRIFERMNFTHSAIGEEVLYACLRNNNPDMDKLPGFEERILYLMQHEQERVELEYILFSLGYTGKYSIYDYLHHLDVLGRRSNRKHILADFLLFLSIGLIFVSAGFGITACLIMVLYNILTYFGEHKKLEPYIISFQFVIRMLKSADKLTSFKAEPFSNEIERLGELNRKVKTMNKGFGMVEKGNQPISGGNPLDIIADYLRMVLHLDIILFNRMYHLIDKYSTEIDEMLEIIGNLDTCDAIGAFRSSLDEGWCVPRLMESLKGELTIKEGYHLLLNNPVKNSVETNTGILLTGSNASGKSSFLKMVAINGILSQTVHTALASEYQGSIFKIYSSMSLRDNLMGNDSYFMVEIKAIKRILEAIDGNKPVLCFVDEVLRGTNTVERIAASTQILKYLNASGTLCFAATHDIELTYLLEGQYLNYHFEEELIGDDVRFFYKLVPGRTTTKNAILLLKQLGYEEKLTEAATALVQHFEATGKWSD